MTTTDGRILEFQLSAVIEDTLVGASERVGFDEIALVERRDISIWKTACLLGGAASIAASVALMFLIGYWLGLLSTT